MRRILSVVGILFLLFGFAGRAVPIATPEGRQCPTAKVHTIRVAVKSACGCVVGHIERAPQPGEEEFVQCRCGEKRAAHESSVPPAPVLPPLPLRLAFAVLPPEVAEHRYLPMTPEWSASPMLRPPAIS